MTGFCDWLHVHGKRDRRQGQNWEDERLFTEIDNGEGKSKQWILFGIRWSLAMTIEIKKRSKLLVVK
jgi:hypothetical protein